MKITSKIIFLCVFFLAGSAIHAVMGLDRLHRLEGILHQIANVDLTLSQLMGTVLKHQWEKGVLIERWTRVAEEWEDPDLPPARRNYLRDVMRQVRSGFVNISGKSAEAIVQAKALLKRTRGLSHDSAQRLAKQMAEIERKHIQYDQEVLRTFDAFNAADPFIQPAVLRRINRLQKELSELLSQFQSIIDLQVQLRLDQTRRQVQTTWMLMNTSWLFLLLIGGLASWWLIRDIRPPLKRLTEAAERIGRGQFDVSLPAQQKRDEIGEVSRAFITMSHRLNELTQELKDKNRVLKTQLAAIKAQKQELERVTRELDLLVSIIGHDLRSPTMALVWYVDHLKKSLIPSLSERDRDTFDRLVQAVDKLNDHLEELLSYSKWVRMKGRWEKVPLDDVIKEVLDRLELLIERHQVRVVQPDHWPVIWADRMKIREIFSNLIGNAVKYSSIGGRRPEIVFSCEETEREWIVRIEDNGIGIPEEEQPYVFEMFHRGRRSIESEEKGHGVGLAIVKALVDAHGGTIRVASRRPVGAVFTVVFPKHPPFLDAVEESG